MFSAPLTVLRSYSSRPAGLRRGCRRVRSVHGWKNPEHVEGLDAIYENKVCVVDQVGVGCVSDRFNPQDPFSSVKISSAIVAHRAITEKKYHFVTTLV